MTKKCPWCGEPVYPLGMVFFKKPLKQCKSCKNYMVIKNPFTSLLIYCLYLIFAAVFLKGYITNITNDFGKIVILGITLLSSLFVYLKVIRLDRYKS